MPLTLWRLVKARHTATAFDGEGARRYLGGRGVHFRAKLPDPHLSILFRNMT